MYKVKIPKHKCYLHPLYCVPEEGIHVFPDAVWFNPQLAKLTPDEFILKVSKDLEQRHLNYFKVLSVKLESDCNVELLNKVLIENTLGLPYLLKVPEDELHFLRGIIVKVQTLSGKDANTDYDNFK